MLFNPEPIGLSIVFLSTVLYKIEFAAVRFGITSAQVGKPGRTTMTQLDVASWVDLTELQQTGQPFVGPAVLIYIQTIYITNFFILFSNYYFFYFTFPQR